jgi:hypothetical protein
MNRYNTLSTWSRTVLFLAWVELVASIFLTVYTHKNAQFFTGGLTVFLYGMAGFVFAFAWSKIIAIGMELEKYRVEDDTVDHDHLISGTGRNLNVLHKLIERQKSGIFRTGNRQDILELLEQIILSEQDAVTAMNEYKSRFNKTLSNELQGLTGNFDQKKKYLKKFIDFGLVENEFPHREVKQEDKAE